MKIYGIGTDIVKTDRFDFWLDKPDLVSRFFSAEEIPSDECTRQEKKEKLAVRFAAKEAFSKALGTGLKGFCLAEIYITKDNEGKPDIALKGRSLKRAEDILGKKYCLHVSLSHEKEYATAFVVAEIPEE